MITLIFTFFILIPLKNKLRKEQIFRMGKSSKKSKIKFFVYSFLGIFYFFIPIHSGKTILAISVAAAKGVTGQYLTWIMITLVILFCLIVLIKPPVEKIKKHISEEKITSKILYLIAMIIGIMTLFQLGPYFLIQSDTSGLALTLASDVFITVFLAGIVVTLLSSFGLLQFVGILIEPLMRPLYRLPGYAGIDIATSITTSPAVDIYLSNKIFLDKLYTKREVSAVVTNFSICSLGFFIVLCEMAGITQYYGQVVLVSFIISFIIPLITIRIPPLSRIPDMYVDGTVKEKIQEGGNKGKTNILKRAWNSALVAAKETSSKEIINGFIDSAFFAIKIVCYILSIATAALIISTYTPLFQWIGIPIAPILQVFGIPNATEIAPSVLVGITELALPTLIIADKAVAPAASFFIVVLSTLQIIFFTESANAIMESSIPLKVWHLVATFFIRTLIAIPLVALAMHIIF